MRILSWAVALSMAALAWSATPAKKKAPVKKTRSAAVRKSSAKAKGPAKPVARTTWRNRQLVPAPERYKEIQDALATKGYLDAQSVDGTWDQGSIDALKRFQADQNIEASGKINSLSLIALGLGPKREPPPPDLGSSRQ